MAKILYIIHGYPPGQNAGAEWMAKEINTFLLGEGHVIGVHVPGTGTYWGDFVTGWEQDNTSKEAALKWADIVITHLDLSQQVTQECQRIGKPCINIIHHNWEIPHLRRLYDNVACVYNSEWVKKDKNYPHPGIVVRPPINPARFEGIKYNHDGYMTLVNCNKDKGAYIFAEIARSCPDLKFLAVKGHHGPQVTLKAKNITQIENTPDIREVFKQTAVLLVPSIYESYGRIGIEAMACGIPVIAADTPGLRESLGGFGMFVSRNYIPSWLHALRVVNKNRPDELKAHAADTWRETRKQLEQLNNLINDMICQNTLIR